MVSASEPIVLEDTDPSPVSEGPGDERVSEDSDPFSHASEGELEAHIVTEPAPAAEEALTVPMEAEVPPGPSFPGISTFSLSPSINLLLNQCNLVGLDWVEGLKNLTLSGPSEVGFLPSVEDRAGVSSSLVNEFKEPSRDPLTDFTIKTAGPPIILEPDLGKGKEDPDSSSPEDSESGYFLRSCKKKTGGGLGKDPLPVRKGRGRTSNFSKAQSRAKNDLREGKQLSIERALRAVNARKDVWI